MFNKFTLYYYKPLLCQMAYNLVRPLAIQKPKERAAVIVKLEAIYEKHGNWGLAMTTTTT